MNETKELALIKRALRTGYRTEYYYQPGSSEYHLVERPCDMCDGSGVLDVKYRKLLRSQSVEITKCPLCYGLGRTPGTG